MSALMRRRTREAAAQLCRLAASGNGESLTAIARDAGVPVSFRVRAVELARTAIRASLEAGNWREVRAAAEALLRGRRAS